MPFTALAASPTLTLSRIKALMQGTSQSFLDAMLNVLHSADARRLEGEDTWLSRLKKERDVEKKMVFYGVDRWTMLCRASISQSVFEPKRRRAIFNRGVYSPFPV